tara:strand:- start:501 stop:785 length:285 start_codon:yes stop_codon:yes gene_type:complete
METQTESTDGQEAKRIIESEIFKKTIQTLMDGYTNEWMNSEDTEGELRERTYKKLQMLGDFVNELKSVFLTGVMADQQIRETESKRTTRKESLF